MKCTKCQTENKDTAKFCRGCGDALTAGATEQQVQMKICSQCQHHCKLEAKFCLKCGHSFAPAVTAPASKSGEVAASLATKSKTDNQSAEARKSCPECSNSLNSSAKFCGKCGFSFAEAQPKIATLKKEFSPAEIVTKPIEVAAPAPVEAVVADIVAAKTPFVSPTTEILSCPSCGCTLKENAKFCGKCGLSFPAGLHGEVAQISVQTEKVEPMQTPKLDRTPAPSEPKVSQQIVQHKTVRVMNSRSKYALMGAGLVSIIVVAGVSYWWLKVRSADNRVMPTAEMALPAKVDIASAVPAQSNVVSTPVLTTANEAKLETVPSTELVVKQEVNSEGRSGGTSKEVKKEKAPTTVRKETAEKGKHKNEALAQAVPTVPSAPPQVVPDVAIDAQSETMLAMADKMYKSQSYASVLELAQPVLKKYPGSQHASQLVNNSRAAIDKQRSELMGKLQDLTK